MEEEYRMQKAQSDLHATQKHSNGNGTPVIYEDGTVAPPVRNSVISQSSTMVAGTSSEGADDEEGPESELTTRFILAPTIHIVIL